MQSSASDEVEELKLALKIMEPVVVGLSVLAIVAVTNRGNEPKTISSRLNLSEGDLEVIVTDPEGNQQRIIGAGAQPDTSLRVATLPPREQLVSAINLLYTSVGTTFPAAGNYSVQAVFYPAPGMNALYSESVRVEARLPRTSSELKSAEILDNDVVKNAIIKAEKDYAPKELSELAANCQDILDGKLASLLVYDDKAASDDVASSGKIFPEEDPTVTALLITALSTPFSSTGQRLKDSFEKFLETAENKAPDKSYADPETAVKIIKEQSISAAERLSVFDRKTG